MHTTRRASAWIRSHPLLADAVLVVALLGAARVSADVTIGLFKGDPTFEPPDKVRVTALLAAMVLPLALRRRAPLTVLVISTAAFIALGLELGPRLEQTFTVMVLSLAFYSAAAHSPARRRNWVCAACLTALMAYVVHELHGLGGHLPVRSYVFVVLGNCALFGALWALGAALASGRRRARDLLDRTMELEREREENARRAVFEERVRIARELHDVVAHHVSMMGVQAGAARVVIDRDRGKARQALAAIETSSRQA